MSFHGVGGVCMDRADSVVLVSVVAQSQLVFHLLPHKQHCVIQSDHHFAVRRHLMGHATEKDQKFTLCLF